MKSLFAKSIFIVIVAALVTCYGSAQAAEWRQLAEASTGIFQYDKADMSTTPEGFVRVWIYNTTKRETNHVEFNCKEKKYHVLDVIQYDEARRIQSRETYYNNPTHNWYDISPKSIPEALSRIVCP